MSYIGIGDDFRKLHSSCNNKFDPTPDEVHSLYSELVCYFSMYEVCISQYEDTKHKEFLRKAYEFFSEMEIRYKKYLDAFYDYRRKLI